MRQVNRLTCACLLISLAPAPASAQAPATTFAELPQALEVGRKVVVTDAAGQKATGRVVELTPVSITLLTPDEWGIDRRQMFTEHSVRTIKRTDSVWNGLLIGLGAGIVGAELFVRYNCGPRGYDDECAAIATLAGWATFVPGGAAVGALIDRFTGNTLLYRAGPGGSTTAIAPIAGRGRGGVAMSLRFD